MTVGFDATVALSTVMVMIDVMAELDIACMLGGMMGQGPIVGWIGHLTIGSLVWGALFAVLNPGIPADPPGSRARFLALP